MFGLPLGRSGAYTGRDITNFGVNAMDATRLIAAINLLVEQMDHEADDLHEVHLKLREHLEQLKATGMPLPDDLVELDRRLTENVEGAAPDETD
jgi:hypothetical protein